MRFSDGFDNCMSIRVLLSRENIGTKDNIVLQIGRWNWNLGLVIRGVGKLGSDRESVESRESIINWMSDAGSKGELSKAALKRVEGGCGMDVGKELKMTMNRYAKLKSNMSMKLCAQAMIKFRAAESAKGLWSLDQEAIAVSRRLPSGKDECEQSG
jgi:hypothetical protein